MDIISNFIEAVNNHADDEEVKKSFIGFANDAKNDPVKMEALEKFINDYMHSNGSFDPIMYENPSYALLDIYDEVLESKK